MAIVPSEEPIRPLPRASAEAIYLSAHGKGC